MRSATEIFMKGFYMRMKLPFLAGAIAFIVAGNAIAGQVKESSVSVANPPSSGGKITSARSVKTLATAKAAEKPGSNDLRISSAFSFGRIPSDTSTKNSRDENAFPPSADLHVSGSNSDNKDQTFSDSSHGQDNNYFGGGPSGDFGYVPGGHAGEDISSTFFKQFENTGDFSNGTGDSTSYFSCSIVAVPEPDGWLLMLFGLGLVGIIAALRKQEAAV